MRGSLCCKVRADHEFESSLPLRPAKLDYRGATASIMEALGVLDTTAVLVLGANGWSPR